MLYSIILLRRIIIYKSAFERLQRCKTEYHNINYDLIEREIEILIEAIDFHCYPQMLNMLSKSTFLNKDVIKQHIWFVESGYNYRKPETQESSKLYEANIEWKKIEKYLDETRYLLIK